MSRRFDVDEIHLQIFNVDFWSPHEMNKGGMMIYWDSDMGCGTLTIVKSSGNDGEDFESPEEDVILTANTEYMDTEDDKEFTRKILSLLADFVKVDG